MNVQVQAARQLIQLADRVLKGEVEIREVTHFQDAVKVPAGELSNLMETAPLNDYRLCLRFSRVVDEKGSRTRSV